MESRTRTQTVVFTDMADYTRNVVGADRDALRVLLSQHQSMVEPIITRRNGRIVKNIGDSFMALFDSATDAVRACLDLVEANPPGSGGVTFRASCATGDVEVIEGDAFSETVNLSSRINAKTPAGEVWISAGTWHCMNEPEIPWESTGRHALKGIPAEVEIFRAVAQHQAIIPETLVAAIRTGRLVVWQAGDPVPVIPPNGHVVLVGFRSDAPALANAVDSLPVVDASHLWLQVYKLGPAERLEWVRHNRGLLVATPAALNNAIQKWAIPVQRHSGSDTIILDASSLAVLNLVIAGLCLPSVPYADVVAGYSYDLLADGRWVNKSDRALLRLDVSGAGASLTVLGPGVTVGGASAGVNSTWRLTPGTRVGCAAGTFDFHQLNAEGYFGALVGDTQLRLGVGAGQRVELGREPKHPGMLLPDRNNQDNIRWCPGQVAARAREKAFTLDKSLTGRHHAEVSVVGDAVLVNPLHKTLPTLLMTPSGSLARLAGPQAANVNDFLFLGTTVVAIRDSNS